MRRDFSHQGSEEDLRGSFLFVPEGNFGQNDRLLGEILVRIDLWKRPWKGSQVESREGTVLPSGKWGHLARLAFHSR